MRNRIKDSSEWNHATQAGKLQERYAIYLQNCSDRFPKSFDEWIGV